jgi:cellulose synthase (UDP-forming)
MALFLVDGRDSDGDDVKVYDGHIAEVKTKDKAYDGVTTLLTEHNLTVFLDESEDLSIGTEVTATVTKGDLTVSVKGIVTGIRESRGGRVRTHTIEILDFGTEELEWLQILFDRIPTLPQSLQRDFGVFTHLWQNIAYRVARTTRT